MFYDGPSQKHCHGVLLGTRDCILRIKGTLNLIGLCFIPLRRPVNLHGINFSSFVWLRVFVYQSRLSRVHVATVAAEQNDFLAAK